MARSEERDRRFELAEAALSDYFALVASGEAPSFEAWTAERPRIAAELQELHSMCCALREAVSSGGVVSGGDEPAAAEAARRAIEGLRQAPNRSSEYAIESVPISEGGMGTVFAARDRTLGRSLAIKVLREDDGSAAARRIVRFLEEARITSQLDHPGIVPVHEIGIDAANRPYFTMKRVRGVTLERVLELAAAGDPQWPRARVLEVLERVCEAVAFAHRSGVVHRDLKPANVMVGDLGEVYVMDWGLARVLGEAPGDEASVPDSSAPEDPLRTREGDVLGTPAYMAPEQALGRGSEVGPPADVYAIGAMLYELLAGRAPYGEPGRRASARVVLERVRQGPPLPLREVALDAPAELAAICDKAMERDPARRYPDVAGLSCDLTAYLQGRVVLAHGGGAWVELRKWVRRNRGLSAAAALAIVSLAAGGVTSLIYAGEARRQADNASSSLRAAELAREQAEANAELAHRNEEAARRSEAEALASERRAKRVTELVQQALRGSDPYAGGTRSLLVVDAMENAIDELERGALADDPETEAALQTTIARILLGNGRPEKALELARRALETHRARRGEDHADVACARGDVGCCLQRLGRHAEALPELEASLATLRRLHPGDHRDVATSLNEVALSLDSLGRGTEALPLHREALEMRVRLFPGGHADLAQSRNNLALCLANLRRYDEALPEFAAALEMHRRVHGGDHPDVALALMNHAGCLDRLGRGEEALPAFDEALAMGRRLYDGAHPTVAGALGWKASCLSALGRRDEALELQREALAMRRELYPDGHPELAASLHNVAAGLAGFGRHEEALPLYEESLRMNVALLSPDHPSVASCASGAGSCLEALGRPGEAVEQYRRARDIRRAAFGERLEVAVDTWSVARCLDSLGSREEALAEYEAGTTATERALGPDHPSVARCLLTVARCLDRLGRRDDALARAEQADEISRRASPEDRETSAACRKLLEELRGPPSK